MSTATDNTNLLEHALTLSRRGFYVFPVKEGVKRPPLITDFPTQATRDEKQIREWWTKWPRANVAISTSRYGDDEALVVVDVDNNDEKNGDATLDLLEELEGHQLPETYLQTTPTGGRHYIYRYKEVVKQGAGALGPGLDIRSKGGYVLAAGSVIGDKSYELSNDDDPAPVPPWVVELCGKAHNRDPNASEPACPLDTEQAIRHATYYLENEAETAVEGSKGDETTYKVACRVMDYAISAEVAADLMFEHWNERCAPPWHYDDLREKAENAEKYRQSQAGSRAPAAQFPPVETDETQPPAESGPLGAIKLEEGQLPTVVANTEKALIEAGAGIYQRSAQLVRVADADPGGQLIQRPEGAPVIVPVERAWLTVEATRYADFLRYDKRAKEWQPRDCPDRVAAALLARSGDWRFPTLRGIIQAPTLRQDGALLAGPGLDVASGLLVRTDLNVNLPDNPSRADALSALAVLRAPFSEFPFASPADEAVALSGILTALIRPTLPTAPLHIFSSPAAGTGKSLFVDAIGVLATGRPIPTMAQGADDTELEKRLSALLLEGDPVATLDNLERPLRGEFLCSMLTQTTVKVRILGQSKQPYCPTTLALFATGNNVIARGDVVRRSLLCRIDAQCERPDARQFQVSDLRAHVAERREQLVAAALTILRAHFIAGQPFEGTLLGSFEHWSRWVRGSLTWLGLPDPATTTDRLREADPAQDELRRVVTTWCEVIGDAALSVKDVVANAWNDVDLREALEAVASSDRERINVRRLGWWLARHQDVVVDGVALRRGQGARGRTTWMIR